MDWRCGRNGCGSGATRGGTSNIIKLLGMLHGGGGKTAAEARTVLDVEAAMTAGEVMMVADLLTFWEVFAEKDEEAAREAAATVVVPVAALTVKMAATAVRAAATVA